MPRLAGPDPLLPMLFTTAEAVAAGLTPDQIRHRLRSGRWVRIGRGHYRRSDWAPEAGVDEFSRTRIEHIHRAVAAVRRNPDCVLGFATAALLHQLPLFDRVPDDVCLIAPPGGWTGRRSGVLFRQAPRDPRDVAVQGVPVTTPVRTWVDVARTSSLRDALASGDGGIRLGVFDRSELTAAVARLGSVRGCRQAALAVAHVSGLRESVLESGSWAYFVAHRLPLPRMQVEFRAVDGRLIGRVDFSWDFAAVIGECDGRVKSASGADLYHEKRREDELRDLGQRFVRWGWTDLSSTALAARLSRALGVR